MGAGAIFSCLAHQAVQGLRGFRGLRPGVEGLGFRSPNGLSTYIVECRVFIIGVTIMIMMESTPHNTT